jgi:hypothetical protein
MQAVLARCFERIAPEVHDEQERREFDARCAYWKHVLRRHYLRQVVQPAWVQPITTRAWRGARSMARRIRSLARKVVG